MNDVMQFGFRTLGPVVLIFTVAEPDGRGLECDLKYSAQVVEEPQAPHGAAFSLGLGVWAGIRLAYLSRSCRCQRGMLPV